MKNNQIRCLAEREAKVTVVPWDYDFTRDGEDVCVCVHAVLQQLLFVAQIDLVLV